MSRKTLFFLSLFFFSCAGTGTFIQQEFREWETVVPPTQNDLLYQVFLLGDSGAPKLDGDPVLSLFERFLNNASSKSAAIFLGDNIYNYGLPDTTHPQRDFYERRLLAQLATVEDFKGRVIFIPGNHDWNDGQKGGLETVRRQERYIEQYLDRGNTFLPDNGFPGPHEIKLMDKDDDPRLRQDIRFIALDTQWWLHEHEKPYGDNGDFDVYSPGDVINELQDIIRDRKNDFLIVGAHHPLVSNDTHGGYFPIKTHLRPPIFGSLYAFYRKIFGLKQDLGHYRYEQMGKSIRQTFQEKEEIIYVSGHAHTLQYHKKVHNKRYNSHFIVSGSGSKTGYVAKGRGAQFAYSGQGFAVINYYADGTAWLETWRPDAKGNGKLLYRTRLQEKYGDPEAEVTQNSERTLVDTTITRAANPEYNSGGKLFRAIAGTNHREMWAIESTFPVFDVTQIEGGLTPIRYGGKGQSNTLHLDGKEDKEYVLRSVDKQAGKIWDDALKKSIALDVTQDQFSMLDPYAALVVAPLASAVNVYHTNPTYFVVPDDPALGGFGDLMAGKLALFERKPDNDMRDVASVGRPEEVMGHLDFIREVDGDIDHRVNQPLFARSRLFDMFIGDWDRHYDQWRWAAIEPEDEQGKIYEPIPRDRDVAMMRLNGIVPTLAKLGPFFQYQNFEESYGSLKGLNYNSLGLTRRFTNQLSRKDWHTIALQMQQQLTDSVIEQAVAAYPDPVEEQFGEEKIRIFKARRDQLVEVADSYLDLINSVVSIPASHKRELITISILHPDTIRVEIHKLAGDGEQRDRYFDRTFYSSETDELRIFAMGDDDRIVIQGEVENTMLIRIIGGAGNDELIDNHPQIPRNILVYDTDTRNSYPSHSGITYHFSENPEINHYDYNADYSWNSVIAGFYFAFNDDDGLFIGGGPRFSRSNFRKNPDQKHYIRANIAPITGAINIRYTGDWYTLQGNWHGNVEGRALLPKNYQYFFGLGNETTRNERFSDRFYRAQLQQYAILGTLRIDLEDILFYHMGAGIQATAVNDIKGESNILNQPQLGVNPNIFENQYYSRFQMGLELDDVDDPANPKYGFNLGILSTANIGMNTASESHLRLESSLTSYFSASTTKQITLVTRVGGTHIYGNFPFYEANTIGARHNLRGFNGARFSGRSSAFANAELRAELFSFYRYLLGGKGGLLTFYDTGRVWTDGESSSIWHKGYGGGVWFNVFDQFLVSANYGFSTEDRSFEIKAGFFF